MVTAPPQPATRPPKGSPQALQYAFDNAVNAFKYQDFENAIPQLRTLVYPKVDLDQKREWKVREYLAAGLWWQNDNRGAMDEFTALLVRNPQSTLDPAIYPPRMVSDFDTLRENLIRLGVIKADQAPRLPDLPSGPPAAAPFALTLFPLGVGQFANREPVRGTAFLLAQVLLGSVSAGYYLSNRDLGARGERSDSAVAIQVSTGIAFWLVAGWGIADAIVHHKRSVDQVAPPP